MASFLLVDPSESLWYPDSVAASHMKLDKGILTSKTAYCGSGKVQVGNGRLLSIKSIGHLSIMTPLTLKSMLHVPGLKHNLLSVRHLCHDNDCHVQFTDSSFFVKDNNLSDVLLQGSSHDSW